MLQSGTRPYQESHILHHSAPEEGGMDGAQLSAGINRAFAEAMEERQIVGGICVVIRRGSLVFEKAYGYRSVAPTTETTTLDTIYDLASLTKPVATASAVMKLVEQGRLRLRERVQNYLPEWKNTAEADEQSSEIARLRRYLRNGALIPAPGLLQVTDSLTTSAPGGAPLHESPVLLWTKLQRENRIRFSDSFMEDLLRFQPPSRQGVTVKHLLTHTSGLDPYERYYLRWPEGGARSGIIADIAARKLSAEAGERFIYSDLGFIALGEIVERVTSMTLAEFTRTEIFGPIGMHDTGFTPAAEFRPRIAPTEWRSTTTTGSAATSSGTTGTQKMMIRGEVHDGNASVQDGISGHAGLFSTARDLSVFCQMLLNGGEYAGTRIFSPLTVAAMTRDQGDLDTGEKRGLGWDISTSYSSPRGDLFDSGFGHTGWTGTSLWIVPEEEIAIIILTNRVHPDGTGDASPLRAKIANVVAGSITSVHRGLAKVSAPLPEKK